MAQIGTASGELKLPIGQTPRSITPDVNRELQSIYNALHISNAYLTALRLELESSDDNNPAENITFSRKFKATAAQNITAGQVCAVSGNSAYLGVGSTGVRVGSWVQSGGEGWNRSRNDLNVDTRVVCFALTDAAAGGEVELGVGPGILRVDGIRCGSIVWGKDWRNVRSGRDANSNVYILVSQELVGDGSLYTSNPIRTLSFTGGGYRSEGVLLSAGASPDWFGGLDYFTFFVFLHPIGIAVADNFVFFDEYIFQPSPSYTF